MVMVVVPPLSKGDQGEERIVSAGVGGGVAATPEDVLLLREIRDSLKK